jgi:hypothetical protein
MYPSDTVLARGPEFKPQYCKKKKKKKVCLLETDQGGDVLYRVISKPGPQIPAHGCPNIEN